MKTGLSSLKAALRAHGFVVQGRDRRIWNAFVRGDFDTVMAHYDTADAFADWPHPYMYRPFLKKYGEAARFVLTTRAPDDWYASLLRHNAYAHPITHTSRHHFGRFYPHGFPEHHKAVMTRHNEEVVAWFAARGLSDRLLILETKGAAPAERLAAFIGAAKPLAEYPRENRSDRRRNHGLADPMRALYNKGAQPLYAALAPKLLPMPGPYFRAVTEDLRHHRA